MGGNFSVRGGVTRKKIGEGGGPDLEQKPIRRYLLIIHLSFKLLWECALLTNLVTPLSVAPLEVFWLWGVTPYTRDNPTLCPLGGGYDPIYSG